MNGGLIQGQSGGRIVRLPEDFWWELAQGRIKGAHPFSRYGKNLDIDTGTVPEDVWPSGGTYVWPTAPRLHDFVSTDAADAAAGTGARQIQIVGLPAWDQPEIAETLTLNGTTAVTTVNAFQFINRVRPISFGSGRTNAGDITGTAQTDSTVSAFVPAGFGCSLNCIYGVPSNRFALLTDWNGSFERDAALGSAFASLQLRIARNVDQADWGWTVCRQVTAIGHGGNNFERMFRPFLQIEGPAVIKVTVNLVGNNASAAAAGFDGIVVDSDLIDNGFFQ